MSRLFKRTKEKQATDDAQGKASQSVRFSNSKTENKKEEKKTEQSKDNNKDNSSNNNSTADNQNKDKEPSTTDNTENTDNKDKKETNNTKETTNASQTTTETTAEKSEASKSNTTEQQTDISNKTGIEEVFSDLNTASLSAEEMSQAVEKYVSLFKENRKHLDNGKIFLIVLMGVLDGNKNFKKMLIARDYKSLDALSLKAYNSKNVYDSNAIDYSKKSVRFIKALAGEGFIPSNDISGINQFDINKIESEMQSRSNVIAAADDPKQYLKHSYYDMIINDCRGRMLRAFPTFYMIIIDEGRRVGKWKLHDNFYNLNSIASISIAQSRKVPTDTAEIIMTNFFNTYSTEDEDLNMSYTYNIRDAVTAIFNPLLGDGTYAEREEQRRTDAMAPERFRLRAGARIHIRMGYGGSAVALPIKFNGVIAELETADVVKIIAQGDGSELSKPILEDKQAWEMIGADKMIDGKSWGENSVTPKQIISILLNYQGGPINKYLYQKGLTELGNLVGEPHNPLGIYHFGNPYAFYAGSRETTQNIFEMGPLSNSERYLEHASAEDAKKYIKEELEDENSTILSDFVNSKEVPAVVGGTAIGSLDLSTVFKGLKKGTKIGAKTGGIGLTVAVEIIPELVEYILSNASFVHNRYDNIRNGKDDDVPRLNFHMYGKTVWDILHICRSIDPEWYTAILPFNMRSTVFFGKEHDYYAYDYIKEKDSEIWYEKRKPFQQYHIYTSYSDIINNGIKVSPKDIKTCASGMYEVQGSLGRHIQRKTDVAWVDAMIFPENQKLMYVDTKLYGAASRKFGVVSDFINGIVADITQGDWIDGFVSPDRAADDTGDVRNHHAMATKMTISALKSQMKEMYQGQITIIGDPSIKPYDRLTVYDDYHQISGTVMARDVVNVFSSEDGYKTVITPDLITRTIGEAAKEEVGLQHLAGITLSTVAGYMIYAKFLRSKTNMLVANSFKILMDAKYDLTLIKDSLKSTDIAKKMKASKIAATIGEHASGFSNAMKKNKLLSFAIKLGEGSLDAIKYAAKTASDSDTFISRFLDRRFIDSNIISKLGLKEGAKTALKGVLKSIGFVVTEALAITVMSTYDKLNNMVNNRRTLVLYPLKKYGLPMVGGVEGHSGIIFGAPNFNDKETSLFNEMFSIFGDDSVVKKFYGGVCFCSDFLEKFFTGREETALKATEEEKQYIELQNELEKSNIDLFRKAYFNPAKPRMKSCNKAKTVYGVYGYTEEAINTNPKMNNMVLISNDNQLKWVMKVGFFRIPTMEKNFNPGLNSQIQRLNLKIPGEDNKTVTVNAIVDEKKTIDVPYLHTSAHGLLREIIRSSFHNLEGSGQQRDAAKWYEDNKDSFIVLASALKINSEDGYENTGCQFILKASNEKTYKAIQDSLKEIQNKLNTSAKENKAIKTDLMITNPEIYKDWNFAANEGNVYIIAYPPETINP